MPDQVMMKSSEQNISNRFSFALASLTTLTGLVVLIGWTLDIGFLKRPIDGRTAMNPVTAVSFILLGISLLILSSPAITRPRKIALYILSVVPLVLSASNLLGFPTDTILFASELSEVQNKTALMVPNTAINLVLLSAAVLLTTIGDIARRKAANVLVGISFVGSLFAIIGYSYNVPEFEKIPFIAMAIHSAIAFMATGISLLSINGQVGFMSIITSRNSGGAISRVIIPMALIFATLIGYTRLIIEAEFPISVELGVSMLLTTFVSIFVVIVIFVAGRLNKEDVDRREGETNLEKMNSALEQQVEQRTVELSLNERKYQALINQSIDAVSLTDLEGNLIYQSPAAERITGYSYEERKRIKGADVAHPEDIKRVAEQLESIKHTPGKSVDYIWRVKIKSGEYRWMEGVATNLLNDPNIGAFVNNYRDVTERVLSEERLAQSERRFRALSENSADAIVLTDPGLRVLYQSPSAERMTGISLEHRLKNPGVRYTVEEDIPKVQVAIEQSKTTPGKPVPFQSRIVHMYGHVLWIEGTITNLLDDPSIGALVFNYRDITERRKLEEQQALFTSLVNSSGDAIVSMNLDGIITSWNRGAKNLFGYSSTEAVGENIMILVPEELRQEEASILQSIRNGENIDTFETRRIRKDGTEVFLTITASPIRDADGNIVGASKISHDITERLDSQNRLDYERSMLRTLIDNIPDFIYVKDLDSKHVINNQAMIDLIGAGSEAETLGKSSIDFFGANVASGYLEEDRKIMQTGQPMLNFEESTTTKAGEHKYLLTTKVALRDTHNHITGIVGISRDITHQKETELDLRNSKYFLERAQQVANVGHWTFEHGAGTLGSIRLSKEAASIFGVDSTKFDGKLDSFLKLVHPDDRIEVQKVVSSAIVNMAAYSLDHRLATSGSDEVWVHVQTEVTFDEERGRPMLLGIVQDITTRKKNESEILSLNADLEKKVSQRTSQLEAVNKELEAFSYSVSHDLRAPLRIIDGFATILVEDTEGLDEKIIKHVKTISRNATRMGQLIDDLLNFSRLGRTQMKVSDVNMNSLVEQVLEEFKFLKTIGNATINIGPLDHAQGDGSLLKQVWVNLLSNAIKYSSKKPNALVEVGMLADAPVPTWYVKDNGAGFDMVYSGKLFGVFQRLHKQDEFEGTGVGLALVQRIIVRHGGKVWADSKLGEGSTFFFTLTA